jgi:hypothetical protein
MVYSMNDLQVVTALEAIRSRPDMYLRGQPITGDVLASRLIEDILVVRNCIAFATRIDEWWVVASDRDWIGIHEGEKLRSHFNRIVAFPEAGVNTMHSEVLITAFAKDVFTSDTSTQCVIHGSIDGAVNSIISDHPEWKRLVAFRV